MNSTPNKITALDAAMTLLFQTVHRRRGASEFRCSAAIGEMRCFF